VKIIRGNGQAPSSNEARRFYSVAEVAEMLGTSEMTLYRAINAGEFPAIRIRGRLIVPAKALEAMEEAATSTGSVVNASAWALGSAG
jgi:excisionase family DNA binding protein